MARKELHKLVLKISDGVLGTVTDLALYTFFCSLTSFGKHPNPRDLYKIFQEANQIQEEINYQTFKQALYKLKRKGFLKFLKEKYWEPQITAAGKKRLSTLFPFYDSQRFWDKKIYLITYDISTTHNFQRDLLREYLKKIGCASLQASVWLTPYNPKRILKEFTQEHHLGGAILVSDLGSDGNIGEEDLKTLIARVYNLEGLNYEYQEFIKTYSRYRNPSPQQVSLAFYQILLRDPQLPFSLLSNGWTGNKAHRLFQKLTQQTQQNRKE